MWVSSPDIHIHPQMANPFGAIDINPHFRSPRIRERWSIKPEHFETVFENWKPEV